MGGSRAQNFNSTTYHGKRKDGSSFVIAQVESGVINGVTKPIKMPDPLYTSSYAYDMAYKIEEQKRIK